MSSMKDKDEPTEFEIGQVVEIRQTGEVGIIMQQASFMDFDGQAYIEHYVSLGNNGLGGAWYNDSQLQELVDISKIGH